MAYIHEWEIGWVGGWHGRGTWMVREVGLKCELAGDVEGMRMHLGIGLEFVVGWNGKWLGWEWDGDLNWVRMGSECDYLGSRLEASVAHGQRDSRQGACSTV
jgi:hypothetical protein